MPKPPCICCICGKSRAYPIIELTLPTGVFKFCSLSCFDEYQKLPAYTPPPTCKVCGKVEGHDL